MKILITAFEPFGGETTNPSMTLLSMLPDTLLGSSMIKCLLPVTFDGSKAILKHLILKEEPDIVLSLGQAGGRSSISIEQIAINLNEASIADNEGNQPQGLAIERQGPDGMFSTLPIKAMLAASINSGVPTSISYTAGTYVCNHVMYVALHTIATHHLQAKAGFIHIPYECSQTLTKPTMASMPIDLMYTGIIAMLSELLEPKVQCVQTALGETH